MSFNSANEKPVTLIHRAVGPEAKIHTSWYFWREQIDTVLCASVRQHRRVRSAGEGARVGLPTATRSERRWILLTGSHPSTVIPLMTWFSSSSSHFSLSSMQFYHSQETELTLQFLWNPRGWRSKWRQIISMLVITDFWKHWKDLMMCRGPQTLKTSPHLEAISGGKPTE